MRAAANVRPSNPRSGYEPLTNAELRLLQHLPSHRTLVSIAAELFVAHSTAKTHSLSVYRKLGVNNRAAAIERAVELGLLPASAQALPAGLARGLHVVPSGPSDADGAARRAHPSA